MVRSVLLVLLSIVYSSLSIAQLQQLEVPGWWRSTTPLSAQEVLHALQEKYQLEESVSFERQHIDVDPLGFTHLTYQQLYNTIPVEGAYVHIHFNHLQTATVNEFIIKDLDHISSPTITSEKAIEITLAHQPASRYAWEDPMAEHLLQRATGQPWSTHYPSPTLMIKRPLNQQEATALAYEVEVFSLDPIQKTVYYVDATSGSIIDHYDALCSSSVEGTAHTRYHGVRSFMTDSVGPEQYRLRDYSRGQGIETYDMNEGGFISRAEDFYDTDNIWDTVNPQQNEVAHDVHWGAQQSYDYFLQSHGLDSYDGNGSPIVSYVHFAIDYINAFWSGSWMAYGDADSSRGYYPLTTVDVVAHELTHGVTRASSNLIYRNEHGALNESFSDIFGKAVEWYADSANFSWRVARQALANGQGIRSMSNPNVLGDPDTYLGNFWEFGSFDNGGVHINSGVQNKWFQLLVEGGTHINDNGDTTTVPAIGWEAAEAIAYRNNHVYLSRFSTYIDARYGSLQAARDLYGSCSPEFQSVSLAWSAVGVGKPIMPYRDLKLLDFIVRSGCYLTDNEPVQVIVYNNSCDDTIKAGTPTALRISGSIDYYHLTKDLLPAAIETWPFNAIGLDLSQEKTYTLEAELLVLGDTISTENNIITKETTHREEQKWDVGIEEIVGPTPSCFLGEEGILIRFRYYGCSSLPTGTEVPVRVDVNNRLAFIDTLRLSTPLHSDQSILLLTNKKYDFSAFTKYSIQARTLLASDGNIGNNAAPLYTFETPFTYKPGQRMQFVNFTRPLDSILVSTSWRSEAELSVIAGNGVGLGLQLSGTNVNPRPRYDFPDSSNVWQINGNSRAQACWCVDATNSATMAFTFDRKQTRAMVHQVLAGQDLPYSSPLRVTVNGQQVSPTYLPATFEDDDWATHTLILDSLAGQPLEVCVEARALSNRAGDVISSVGDNAYIDNIFFGVPQVTSITTPDRAVQVRLFPNPAHTQLTIASAGTLESVQLRAIDITGRTVWQREADQWQQSRVSTAAWAPGQYWIQLRHQHGVTTLPVVIQH